MERFPRRVLVPSLTCAALILVTAPADAQDPDWKDPEKDEKAAEKVEWSASAQAGLVLTTGNSRTTTVSAGAKASRKKGFNKFRAEANLAYARSSIFLASDDNMDGVISADEIERPSQTTARAWDVMARYDRFLTEHNALYALAQIGADVPAGKDFIAGGQAGYSRQLYKDDTHEVTAEAGYDFSYEDRETGGSVSIHSGRVFAGYAGALSKDTSLNANTEVLSNVNSLDQPGGEVDPLEDTRVNSTLELATKLADDITFSFSFTAKYDNAPAPRKAFDLPYADGFVPLADELDTITKASLIINFL